MKQHLLDADDLAVQPACTDAAPRQNRGSQKAFQRVVLGLERVHEGPMGPPVNPS
jgi:hypothetical protein